MTELDVGIVQLGWNVQSILYNWLTAWWHADLLLLKLLCTM